MGDSFLQVNDVVGYGPVDLVLYPGNKVRCPGSVD